MTQEELQGEIRAADLVLVGIGEELSGRMDDFYRALARLLDKKDYFVVTLLDLEKPTAAGLAPERIIAPLSEGEQQESWKRYLRWLSFTLNRKLCLLELGVGFLRPEIIRFPFEKTAYLNQKSRYIRISRKFPQLPAQIADRGISVEKDPVKFFTNGINKEM